MAVSLCKDYCRYFTSESDELFVVWSDCRVSIKDDTCDSYDVIFKVWFVFHIMCVPSVSWPILCEFVCAVICVSDYVCFFRQICCVLCFLV